MTDMLHSLTLQLLNWYDQNKRDLPWRSANPDPYHVWLSEIMLQQTTVPAVKKYFEKFLNHYPTVHDLANASEDAVMADWAGLGYYSRARNLHKTAKILSKMLSSSASLTKEEAREGDLVDKDSSFRWNDVNWIELPGVGRYTAAAINTIAFNKPDVVVDGNVERIMARLFKVEEAVPKAKPKLYELAKPLYDHHHGRSGCLAQSFMDLGSMVCAPKNPKCEQCPIQEFCEAQSDAYPKRVKKEKKPERLATAFWIKNDKGQILVEKRPPQGLLGGTIGLPCTDLKTGEMPKDLLFRTSFFEERARSGISKTNEEILDQVQNDNIVGEVRHIFTHFALTMTIQKAQITGFNASQYYWRDKDDTSGMSSLFKKVMIGGCQA